ncbi:MAG TPA: lactate utilization protein [Candidatus Ozemobacteraceae bacterium]
METVRLSAVAEKLREHGFEAVVHPTPDEAVAAVLAEIPVSAVVNRCGSVTCDQLDLYRKLAGRGNPINDPYAPALDDVEKARVRRAGLTADVLLTGTNAVTADGKLVNIDGVGNRVASQTFGPGRVVIVAGRNKVAADVPAAIRRIKQDACPKNARRIGAQTPCAHDRPCPAPDGCSSPQRMCNVTVILERRPRLTPISIHLVDADLGY